MRPHWITQFLPQEIEGQAELLAAVVGDLDGPVPFPFDCAGPRDEGEAALLRMGFQLGPPLPSDPVFRVVTLPAGWRFEADASHAMWSWVLDRDERRRVGVFYKNAPYDRRADYRIERPEQ